MPCRARIWLATHSGATYTFMNPFFYPVRLYGEYVAWPKRRRIIADALIPFLSSERALLDVGCGDGKLAEELKRHLPGVSVHGVDTAFPSDIELSIPCTLFDGLHLPFPDNAYDACLIVDVLHHSRSPEVLLEEAGRVARFAVVLKDHDYRSRMDFLIMKWGDYLGNRMFGVDLPYNFRTWEEFETMFRDKGFSMQEHDDRLRPGGFMEFHHHFVVRLIPPSSTSHLDTGST